MGGICPLYFDGATCYFEELPLPNDVEGINKIYNRLKQNNQSPIVMFIKSLFKKLKTN